MIFKFFNKNKEKPNVNVESVNVACLLIHAAKIDENYTSKEREIIKKCRLASKPVIVATQIMESMIESSTPTRAEVNDVATAVLDGTDAVMLSAETSVGKYPIHAVQAMCSIIKKMEANNDRAFNERPPYNPRDNSNRALPLLAEIACKSA